MLARGQAVGCGVCDDASEALAWRCGPVCARVRACAGAGAAESLQIHIEIHTNWSSPVRRDGHPTCTRLGLRANFSLLK